MSTSARVPHSIVPLTPSRWRYVRFFTCQRFQILAQGLASCFEVLGGVTARVLFNNAKVTSDFVAGLSVLNPELVRLATHYRFTPVTAAASDPESKGKMEALVRYVRSNLVPEEGFGSLEEANREGERWCREVNVEVHEETRAVPSEQVERERPLLRALVERPVVCSEETRKVDHLSTVRLGAARYSVAHRLRGDQVQVLVDGEEVRVMHRGGEVALHRLQPPGGASIVDEHYPAGARGARPLRPRHPAEVRFLELGQVAERYLRAAASAGTPPSPAVGASARAGAESRPGGGHGRARSGGGVRSLRARGRGRHPARRRLLPATRGQGDDVCQP